ncbi:hypothetical protein CYLTODRAFT_386580 [Cylindrobasidium torrendii FP15055 ss-10]|uniref:Ubiquitin-like domain-containing protein n=1 Tax=Cylindrobasidium torrendii FP15055 ss-10 TaxID=1314674 RepID=A0A0D7BSG7_9AGAR|nr:hypothetical protein CYLTODRAFT_386580 [Cylindrobasidium torrendii FP15055 ss-10]
MNGAATQPVANASAKATKPPPAGPAPPAPVSAPPQPPRPATHSTHTHTHPGHNHTHSYNHGPTSSNSAKAKKKDTPVDPAVMYESLKNRIAALEEEEVIEEEEERRYAEEAQKSVTGMNEKAIHAKYIELFAEFKRLERDHSKEKQKLTKDKDAAKGQLTKANQTKTKMENLARELQKDNKRLREDSKRLVQSVEDAQEELSQMRNDISQRVDRAKVQDVKYREMPDIVVKVVCRYRAELFFKISRKTKLTKLFNAWTERMEQGGKPGSQVNGTADAASTHSATASTMHFIFSHNGRTVESDQSPEDLGMEDGDELLAIELMDLTECITPEWEDVLEPPRQTLRKHWTDDPLEAKRSLDDIFDGVVRERLKEVLRQYELRERHFECVIRSKELEVLLSRARAAEQKQLADGGRVRVEKIEDEMGQLRKDLEDAQNGQAMLIDKLIQCCKEIRNDKPTGERTQRLFASLREELEKRAPRGTFYNQKKTEELAPTSNPNS